MWRCMDNFITRKRQKMYYMCSFFIRGIKRKKHRLLLIIFFIAMATVVLTQLYVDDIVQRRNYQFGDYVRLPLPLYDKPYIISVNRTCTSGLSNAVIVVHSKVTNFVKRKLIRKTWANRALMSRLGFKVVFFLGMPYDGELQSLVDEESSEFKDIVQGSFYDSYHNMTHKAVLVFRWIKDFCGEAPFVVKVDDDVFVNVFALYHSFLQTVKKAGNKVWCEIKQNQVIIRKKGEKHCISENEFKGLSHYPYPICRGYFVILTQESVRTIYDAATRTQFFWIDDVYVYGIIVNSTGIQRLQIKKYLHSKDMRAALACFEARGYACPLIGVLLDSPTNMEIFWDIALNQFNSFSRELKQK